MKTEISLFIRSLAVEFIGDLIFIFIGSLSVISGNLVGIALGHGLTIAILIMAFGHISGGHFNPAVTLGVLINGNINIVTALAYIVAQILGGLFGSLLVLAVLGSGSKYDAILGGATLVPAGTSWFQAIVCELILTYILVNSVLMTAIDSDTNVLAPLAIGLAVTVDIFAGASISGASMNPARSLGPCISASLFTQSDTIAIGNIWSLHYVYWVGPFIGALIAALMFKLVFTKDGHRFLS